jgi:type I restriction enzyme S subunit
VTIENFSAEKYANILAVIPSIPEQQGIVSYIDREGAKSDTLLSSYARQLTLLAEYRASLIHECVTGKRLVTQRTEVEASPTKANVHFLRAVLCSEIVHRLHEEPTFGRVKLEKILFLSEAYAGIDLEGHYQRAAAGPFDNRALRSAESQIQKQKWYQPVKGEKGTRYIPLEKAGEHRKYFARYWAEQQPKFDRIVDLLRKEKTEFCEIVATLFSAWRDRLHSSQSCADDALVDEVLTNWHPSKQRIPRERWLNALVWMKKQGLTPTTTPSPS